MKTYRDRETGQPIRALLWDGRAATAIAEIDGAFSFSIKGDGTLYVEDADNDDTWEMPVKVGEYLMIAGNDRPVAMEADAFRRLVRNVHPLKVYCPCGSHVWATSIEVERDGDGEFWPVETHDRPDGEPCPLTQARRGEMKILTLDDLPPASPA